MSLPSVTSAPPAPTARSLARDATGRSRGAWGLDVIGLHDGWWRTQGIQVVRCRSTTPVVPGDGPWLLVGTDEMCVLDRPARWRQLVPRHGTLQVTMAGRSNASYDERVVSDEHDRLIGLRRIYPARDNGRDAVLLTRCLEVALRWQAGRARRESNRLARAVIDLPRYRVTTDDGLVLRAGMSDGDDRVLHWLLHRWSDIDAICPRVRQLSPGVWAHETAVIADDIRFIAPVWVDAGARLDAGALVVGPCIANPPTGETGTGADVPVAEVAAARTVPAVSRCPRGKRLFDIVISLVGLVLAAPLFALIALVVCCEDGRPIFFAHRRQGRFGVPFACWKFRTMCRNADAMKSDLGERNHSDGPQFHIPNDPRLLRCGRLLRRFHLDELPQLWNVLRGDMSLVGPRPSPEGENQYCPTWREVRLSVRPGLTGLWQVRRTRAREIDFQEWIRYDLEYVRRRGWALEAWILVRTIDAVARGR